MVAGVQESGSARQSGKKHASPESPKWHRGNGGEVKMLKRKEVGDVKKSSNVSDWMAPKAAPEGVTAKGIVSNSKRRGCEGGSRN
jgi:hypothetical protein